MQGWICKCIDKILPLMIDRREGDPHRRQNDRGGCCVIDQTGREEHQDSSLPVFMHCLFV